MTQSLHAVVLDWWTRHTNTPPLFQQRWSIQLGAQLLLICFLQPWLWTEGGCNLTAIKDNKTVTKQKSSAQPQVFDHFSNIEAANSCKFKKWHPLVSWHFTSPSNQKDSQNAPELDSHGDRFDQTLGMIHLCEMKPSDLQSVQMSQPNPWAAAAKSLASAWSGLQPCEELAQLLVFCCEHNGFATLYQTFPFTPPQPHLQI